MTFLKRRWSYTGVPCLTEQLVKELARTWVSQRGPTKSDSLRQARYNVSRRVQDSMKASRRVSSLVRLPCSPASWLLRCVHSPRPSPLASSRPSHCLCPTLSCLPVLEQGPASLIDSCLWFNLPPPATNPCLRSYPVTLKPVSSTSIHHKHPRLCHDSTTRLDSTRLDTH